MEFTFDAELWEWEARRTEGWAFVRLPADVGEQIRDMNDRPRRGFGSLRVEVTLGSSTWRTSIFPEPRRETFVLPIKKPIRRAEAVDIGDTATITLALLDL